MSSSELDEISDESSGEEYTVKKGGRKPKKVKPYIVKHALRPPRTTSYTAQALYDQIHDATINLSPEYQRDVVWTDVKQSNLIDSILRNYYIPPIIFAVHCADDGTETRVCIDGKQRLTSVQKFIDGLIPHRDSITGERLYYDGPTTAKRKVLPKQYVAQFANKQIVCVEYDSITDDQEREIFQRVQNGVALTPAERLQAITGPWASLVRSVRNAVLAAGFTAWRTDRAKDFQCVASAITMIEKYPTVTVWVGTLQLEKYLNRADAVPSSVTEGVKSTLGVFLALAASKEHSAAFTHPVSLAPIEFVMVFVLMFAHRRTLNMADMREAIDRMRADLRKKFAGNLKANSNTVKAAIAFIEAVKPKKPKTKAAKDAWICAADEAAAGKKKRKRAVESDSESEDDSEESESEEESEEEKPLKKSKAKVTTRTPAAKVAKTVKTATATAATKKSPTKAGSSSTAKTKTPAPTAASPVVVTKRIVKLGPPRGVAPNASTSAPVASTSASVLSSTAKPRAPQAGMRTASRAASASSAGARAVSASSSDSSSTATAKEAGSSAPGPPSTTVSPSPTDSRVLSPPGSALVASPTDSAASGGSKQMSISPRSPLKMFSTQGSPPPPAAALSGGGTSWAPKTGALGLSGTGDGVARAAVPFSQAPPYGQQQLQGHPSLPPKPQPPPLRTDLHSVRVKSEPGQSPVLPPIAAFSTAPGPSLFPYGANPPPAPARLASLRALRGMSGSPGPSHQGQGSASQPATSTTSGMAGPNSTANSPTIPGPMFPATQQKTQDPRRHVRTASSSASLSANSAGAAGQGQRERTVSGPGPGQSQQQSPITEEAIQNIFARAGAGVRPGPAEDVVMKPPPPMAATPPIPTPTPIPQQQPVQAWAVGVHVPTGPRAFASPTSASSSTGMPAHSPTFGPAGGALAAGGPQSPSGSMITATTATTTTTTLTQTHTRTHTRTISASASGSGSGSGSAGIPIPIPAAGSAPSSSMRRRENGSTHEYPRERGRAWDDRDDRERDDRRQPASGQASSRTGAGSGSQRSSWDRDRREYSPARRSRSPGPWARRKR